MRKALMGLAIGMYLMISALYWLAVPVGESPDEPGHLQCVEQVVRYGRVPMVDPKPAGPWWQPGVTRSGRMCYHMPLYYLLAGQLQKGVARLTGTPDYVEFPVFNPDFGTSGVMFQHPERAGMWQLSEPPILTVLRLFSVLLGLVTLFAGFQVAAHLYPNLPAAPVLATTLLAGWPQFVFLSRAVSNDVLATALGAGLLIVLVYVGRPQRFPLAALLSAAAIAAKLSMLFTVAVVLIAYLLELWSFSEKRADYLRALFWSILVWALSMAILLGNPTIRDHLGNSSQYWTQQPDRVLGFAYWREVLAMLASSGWGRFGWMNVLVPVWQAYLWWGLIVVTAAIGVVLAWRSSRCRADKVRMAILMLWMGGVVASVIRVNLVVFQPQFRFALASLPLWAAFSAGGVVSLLPNRQQWQWAFIACMLCVMLAVNLWIVLTILHPVYG